jgi:endonuclease G, mitochondrial
VRARTGFAATRTCASLTEVANISFYPLRLVMLVSALSLPSFACNAGPSGFDPIPTPEEDAGEGSEDSGSQETDAGVAPDVQARDAASDVVDPTPRPFTPGEGATLSVHTMFGLPEAAPKTANRILLVKPQFVSYYDADPKIPRWVSWELARTWIGTESRSPNFLADPDLPTAYASAKATDYASSGFDRGHMCPSGDRTKTAEDNTATFVFTNAVPQHPSSNSGPWAAFETEARRIASTGYRVFQISGPLFEGAPKTIGQGVRVPSATWKVVAIVNEGTPLRIGEGTRTIGIIMPNDASASGMWKNFRRSVREIETRTGLNFFADVEPAIQEAIETRVDNK